MASVRETFCDCLHKKQGISLRCCELETTLSTNSLLVGSKYAVCLFIVFRLFCFCGFNLEETEKREREQSMKGAEMKARVTSLERARDGFQQQLEEKRKQLVRLR